jgi:hypothetical protein
MNQPIYELMVRRGREVGVFGVGLVPMQNADPDPSTFRHQYYYNTRENVLYKKTRGVNGVPFWKRISTPASAPPPRAIPPRP